MSKNLTKYFSNITPERRKEIARMGGLAAQAGGKAHRFNSEEGRAASRRAKELRDQKKLEATNAG